MRSWDLYLVVLIVVLTVPLAAVRHQSRKLNERPIQSPVFAQEYTVQDDRPQLLERWFKKYRCPLTEYTQLFIQTSDKYSLDWRLLPAISLKESTCGKRQLGYNSFGFGYYKFSSFPEAIEYVGATIAGEETKDARHYRKADKEPEAILRIYNKRPGYTTEALQLMEDIETTKKDP